MKKLWIFILFLIVVITFVTVFFFVLFPVRHRKIIEDMCSKYELDISLICAVINIESGWDKRAVSTSGAVGLMQVMPSTAKEVAVKLQIEDYKDEDLYDKETNIEIGCFYLKYLLDLFDKNEELALYAYNAGPNKVREWQSNTSLWDGQNFIKVPYKETEKYVKKAKINKKVYNFILQL